MSSNTIFISYSRKDTDFVSKFTKNLREAGANLWLDKQIKPGGHWDTSIESALETCQDVILILSNNSVKSNNVMDEISYALEENKRVIPIKIEDCDIPFRLRRIQHIDYYLDEKKSTEVLLNALNLNSITKEVKKETVIEKSAPDLQKNKVKDSIKTVAKIETADKEIGNESKKKKSYLKYVIGSFIVILAIYFVATSSSDINDDTDDTNEETIAMATDSEDWDLIKESIKIEDFKNHLNTYSECAHVNDANGIIKALQEVAYEEAEWYRAIDKNTSIDYLNYLMDFKKEAIFYKEALNKLDVFFVSDGFVQFSSSTGELYFSIFEPNNENIPEVNDLIFANSQRNIHKGPYGTPGFNFNIHTTSKDEVFKVKDVKMSGSSYWVEVIF
ncbi:MAG: toll/interleukin-1 receptor domain-containing protein [Lutibacter sp.]|uniref:toll/interleukin-1 receptor domain-containing protein n=1 Tax=Lutibacter sp. TaxID=1925666 RepID=UPI00385E0403